MVHLLAGIAWDPQIRGFLAVAVGVVVLMGSIYLLLVTNIGARLGLMLASAAFFGWLTIMGGVWWVYGTIGMLGEAPHWEVVETVYPGTESAGLEEARDLDTSGLPPAEELNDLTAEELVWRELPINGRARLLRSDVRFGESETG